MIWQLSVANGGACYGITLASSGLHSSIRKDRAIKRKRTAIGSYSKGQFYKDTAHLEIGMPYLAFVYTNAVLVRKIDNS